MAQYGSSRKRGEENARPNKVVDHSCRVGSGVVVLEDGPIRTARKGPRVEVAEPNCRGLLLGASEALYCDAVWVETADPSSALAAPLEGTVTREQNESEEGAQGRRTNKLRHEARGLTDRFPQVVEDDVRDYEEEVDSEAKKQGADDFELHAALVCCVDRVVIRVLPAHRVLST